MTAAWDTVAILGVGLIGGSIGLGLLERGLSHRVIGIGRRPATLRSAYRRRAITTYTTDIARGVAEADLIVVCTPVETVADQVAAIRGVCRPDALITDVGSTKASIVAAIQATELAASRSAVPGLRGRFLGSHPMAGSEKTGVRYADAALFQGRAVILTPTADTPTAVQRRLTRFWKSLGARVVALSPEVHDQSVAAISHLPHLVASALAASTDAGHLPLAGGGWRDTTRVAAGDVELWRQIFLDNRQALLPCLDRFLNKLDAFRVAVRDGDSAALRCLLEAGKEIRDAVGN
ncbi:MAG: prephenate dehydrogenase [Planctomycetota bacterium]